MTNQECTGHEWAGEGNPTVLSLVCKRCGHSMPNPAAVTGTLNTYGPPPITLEATENAMPPDPEPPTFVVLHEWTDEATGHTVRADREMYMRLSEVRKMLKRIEQAAVLGRSEGLPDWVSDPAAPVCGCGAPSCGVCHP